MHKILEFIKNVLRLIGEALVLMLDSKSYVKETQNKNKCVCVYTDVFEKEAWGVLYFQGLECKFISGRWGNGQAPIGQYEAYQYRAETRDAFVQKGVGFQVPIKPLFKTDRTFLAIHPDGNVEGTLGCIGLKFESKEHGYAIRNAFRNWFDVHRLLEV